MLIINNLKEMKQYYNKKTNTYEFVDEDNYRLDVEFNCDLKVCVSIYAGDIVVNGDVDVYKINALDIKASDIKASFLNASDIKARSIKASDIKARSIKASGNIEYGAVCYAHNDIECKSIKSIFEFGKHFSLNGEIIIIKDDPKPQEMTIAEIEKILGKKIKIVNNKEN